MKKDKCLSCGEPTEDGAYIADNGVYCWPCYENDQEHASTIVRYNGELKSIRIGEFTEQIVKGDYDDDEFKAEMLKMFGRPVWHDTDGWRGYYEFAKKPDGLKEIADGWLTSWASADDHAYKIPSIDVFQALEDAKENGEDLPFVAYWLFCPTSNVFSTASTIYVDDEKAFADWIKERAGLELEQVKEAFN